MKRNLIVLSCTALFAIGFSFSAFSGSAPDADSDGVPDAYDNCIDVPNGPLASTGQCNDQEDYATNGYGNPCDTDVNHDGATGLDDLSLTIVAQGAGPGNINDFNCDNGVGLDDLSKSITQQNTTPGTSGLPCAAPTATGCSAE